MGKSMRNIIIYCILFVFGISSNLIPQQFDWAKCFNGNYVYAYSVTKDNSGNNFVVGSFDDYLSIDGHSINSAGSSDIFIAKIDHTGNCLWVKRAGGSLEDLAKDVTVDNNGNILITGSFKGVASFESIQITSTNQSADVFVAKYSKEGSCLWVKQSVGNSSEQGEKIKFTSDGKILIAGIYNDQVFFGSIQLMPINSSSGFNDAFMASLDTSGSFVWANSFGSYYWDTSNGIANDLQGNIFFTGTTFQNINSENRILDSGEDIFNNIYVNKYGPSGILLFSNIMGGVNDDNVAGIVADSRGNYFIAGVNSNMAILDTIQVTKPGAFLAKFNPTGQIQWVKTIPGMKVRAKAVDSDAKGNVYITGEYQDTITLGDSVYVNLSYQDLFYIMYDSTGIIKWANTAIGATADYSLGLSAGLKVSVVGKANNNPIHFGDITLECGSSFIADIKNAYLKVTSPNGGEYLKAGTQVDISWETFTLDNVGIEYSTNGGSSWSTITLNASGGSYSWTVPQVSSSSCKIRIVYDDQIVSIQDESDSLFTIFIEGNYSLYFDGIDDYVGDMIENQLGSSDEFTVEVWIKPESNSHCGVVNRADNSSLWSYNLYTAAGTTNWGIKDGEPPSYTQSQGPSFNQWHHIAVTKDNSGKLNIFIDGIKTSTANYQQGFITPSTQLRFGKYLDYGAGYYYKGFMSRVRISKTIRYSSSFIPPIEYALDGNTVGQWDFRTGVGDSLSDASVHDRNGKIYGASWSTEFPLPTGAITVTSPNGGENWTVGSAQNITWTQIGVTNVKIEYTTNSGTSWNQITAPTSATTGSYSWTIPNAVSINCKVRVTDVSNSSVTDESDNLFSISQVSTGNYSLYFDGNLDYVGDMIENKLRDNATFTLELWVKNQSPNVAPLITRGADSGVDWSYNLYSHDRLYYGVNTPPGYVSNTPPSSNEWHHIAAVKSADGYLRIFIDGIKVNELSYGVASLVSSHSLQFGKYFANASSDYFKGFLTKIRISKIARYQNSFTPIINYSLDTNTVGLWNFYGGSGNTLYDASGNGIDGTIYGATWSTDFPQVPAAISLTSPNGGENWTVGSVQNITWAYNGVQNIKLEYTLNNGTSWNQIVGSTSASTGSYSWTIPNSVSNNCKVRITDAGNNSITDQSDAFFTISAPAATITLTSPNGGENWTVGSTHNITWSQTGVTNVKLEYTSNNGTSWNQIVASTSASTGSYSWEIPNSVSNICKVKVTSTINSLISDESNAQFTISTIPVPVVTITSPNGGENWLAGSQYSITWNSSNVQNLKMEYSVNGGTNWSLINAAVPANLGSYIWTIPNTPSSTCKVKITSAENGTVFDESNSNFTISEAPNVVLVSPNGGENWLAGSQYSITWNFVNVQKLKLEYSSNNGSDWNSIDSSVTPNLGSYIWTVPNTPSTSCKVRITAMENGPVSDQSDRVFSISEPPSVQLSSPVGGEKWLSGKQYSIIWSSVNIENVKLEYSANNGLDWTTIEASFAANSGSYIWTVPAIESNQCLVQISAVNNPSISDQSDAPFTIEPERTLSLTAPAGGEVFTSGEKMAITWNSLNLETIDLYYSVDNGGYWGLIADSVDASLSTFNWDIPENNSNQVKIRLVYTRKTELRSENVNTFTILPSPKVILQSNLSGAFLKSGTNQLIEWFVENVSAVNLFYSSDGGTVWNEVALNIPSTTRSHNWVVPQLNSKNCRIKVVSSVNPDLSNSSAGYFTIYTYSESISLVNTWQFGDIKEINNYRLVSMPGNTTENLVNVISGKHIEEWNAYWDNGNDVNYQVQYDGSEIFKFQPGKGFWVLSKNPINLNKQLAAVTIDSTLIFNVSVHRGWNIIGNPFAKSLNWSEIRSINSLPQNRLIYYWDGKWNFPTQMEPFKGYYFFNEDNRSNLKFVYPVEASLAKTGIENQFQNITDGISISFGDNEIFAVFNETATMGLDTNDYLLPGITFSNKNLSFLRDTEDGKKRQLFIESQPMDSLGNSFRIRATNTSGEAGHLQINPRVDLGSNNIYLLDEKYQEFIDVRSKDKFTITPQEESRYYTLLVGSDGFIKSVKTKYLPTEYILYQNYPNPFNPETSIKYALPEDSQVQIKLYDILGNEVITLFEGEEPAGVHTRTFDLSSFASGVYLYRLETRNKSFVKKMVLLK